LKNIFLSFFLLFSFTIFSEENESLELLYKKIEVLEEEIRDLRNILEENSILVDRSLELQQQRYLDLDARILEISKISSENLSSVDEEDQYLDSEEKELYKSALILFEESRFAEALEIFSQIIITFPNGAFTADAYFWSGELFLAQEMFEDAKLSFKNVVDNFYQHSRTPDSLFKLGEIYRIEGDIERSYEFYEKVKKDFPDSGAFQLSKKSQEILKEESNLVE
jgi:tol-pal system protein YbgF|tara:strand:- start:8282 stop:8953 length:672 start_codon:yes stop_codon:yes gene_type:complete